MRATQRRLLDVAMALAVAMLLSAPLSYAGSFQVNPIRVELGPGAASQTLMVRNDGSEPLVVQLSVQAWSQAEGRDVYEPTTEALVTPPIAQIAPGAEQVVRVGLRRAPDPLRQLTFRLFVNEVPPPPAPGFAGLQVALRIGIPVFVAPSGPLRRDVGWSASRLPDGSLRLAVANRGNVHLQLLDLALRIAERAEPVATQQQLAYVLAGQSREFVLPARWPGAMPVSSLKLTAFTDAGEIDATLPLGP